jgi:hypothetical protein
MSSGHPSSRRPARLIYALVATFVVTLSGASRAVSLAPATLTVLDEFGARHHPQVSAAGGAAPRILRPGQTVRLIVRAQLPVGNGRLQWAPDGRRAIVAWDFDVELN